MEKRLKIILIISILLVLAIVFYFIFFRSSPDTLEPPIPDQGELITSPLPISPDKPPEKGEEIRDEDDGASIKRISDNKAFDVWAISEEEVFYITPNGEIFRILEKEDGKISQQTIIALNLTEISTNKEKVLVSFGDPLAPEWGIFDLADKVWRPLGGEIIQATWGESSEELFVVILDEENIPLLARINLISQEEEVVQNNFLIRNIRLLFKPPNNLLILEPPSSRYANRIWVYNLDNKTLSLLLEPENGTKIKMSPEKSYLLKTSSNNFSSVFDENISLKSSIPFEIFPSKCAFNENFLYCFINQSEWPRNASLPEDYMMKKLYSIDTLLEIDLKTGETKRVFASGEKRIPSIDAKNPVYLNGKIYFINRYDDYVYELDL